MNSIHALLFFCTSAVKITPNPSQAKYCRIPVRASPLLGDLSIFMRAGGARHVGEEEEEFPNGVSLSVSDFPAGREGVRTKHDTDSLSLSPERNTKRRRESILLLPPSLRGKGIWIYGQIVSSLLLLRAAKRGREKNGKRYSRLTSPFDCKGGRGRKKFEGKGGSNM